MPYLAPGSLFAERYRIGERIAVGGQGTVHAATREGSERRLAIKVLHEHLAADPKQREAFAEEAELTLRVAHPNVCRVYASGQAEGLPYIVMERLDGVSFARLDDGRRDVGEPGDAKGWRLCAISVLHDAALGLHAAHVGTDDALGIIHRDVKPSNLVVCEDGTAKVIDFGIGRPLTPDAVTASGEVRGTLAYLAPERFGGRPGSAATDVWALGVVLFEATQDEPLLPVDGFWEAFGHLSTGRWDESLAERISLEDPLRTVLLRALRREPGARWQSAHHFAEALRASVPEAAWARRRAEVAERVERAEDLQPETRPVATPSRRRRRSRRWLAGAGMAGLVALITGLAVAGKAPRKDVEASAPAARGSGAPAALPWTRAPIADAAPPSPPLPVDAAHPRASELRSAIADYYGMRFAEANDALTVLVASSDADPAAHYYRALVRAFGFGKRVELPMEPPPADAWPDHPARRAVLELAIAFEEGRCGAAAETARPVAEAYPQDFELWFALGECLFHGGDPREGFDAFVRSVELEPRFLPAVVHVQSFLVLQPTELLMRASRVWGEAGYEAGYLEVASANWTGDALPTEPTRAASAVLLTAWRQALDGDLAEAAALLER
ncbi:MAG: protein kinase, partial [Myxococcota bacterium]